MMMPMKDDDDNWLGFSLSPHMKMEADNTASDPYNHHFSHHHHHHETEAPHPSSSTFVGYGLSENGGFQSPLSVMPLKSDGSLCIMEALSRSHSQGSSPKLENFLGGATPMATQQRDASSMFLSLDSTFYNQDPFRQQQYYYYNNGLNYTNQFINPPISYQSHEFSPKTWINDNEHNQDYENHFNNSTMVENKGHHNHHEFQQSLSLSMSPGSQSSCVTKTITTDCVGVSMKATTKKRGGGGVGSEKQTVHRKSIDTFGQRTSQFRGVTRHRWTGRYEAHLWDNSIKKEGQTRKGRQVYLGGYDMEDKAARAYDLAALKYWGCSTHINFSLENYHQELEEMKNMSRQEYVAHLRRRSSGFSRGASMYRGVTRHHQHGRWQARIGRVAGNKDLYLGTFSTQEEAAEAYDVAAIKFRGTNAVTNFDMSRYDVEKIMASNTLPSGETARRKNVTGPIIMPENVTVEPHNDVKTLSRGDYHQNHSFSAGQQDLICMGSGQRVVDEETNHHFSNPSSLVTSLSSSREGSPDRNGAQLVFARPDSLETKFISSSSNVNSWIQASNMPVFTSWNDITLV
ncbi:hypothetical protein OROMI_010791 [Orobanche minor]